MVRETIRFSGDATGGARGSPPRVGSADPGSVPPYHPRVSTALFLKHAESTWNAKGRWQGLYDAPLSERGERDTHAAALWLSRIRWTRIVSSDLARSRRTAEIIARELGMAPPESDAGFNEYDHGEWVGLTRDKVETRWPGAPRAWRDGKLARVPGGEGREDFVARLRAAIERLRSTGSFPVLVIAHGGVIEALTALSGAEHRPMRNLAGRWFELTGPRMIAQDFVDILGPSGSEGVDPGTLASTAPLRGEQG